MRGAESIQDCLKGDMDWNRFYGLAKSHGVQPLVWTSLHKLQNPQIPKPILKRLFSDFQAIAHNNLAQLGELNRIGRAFQAIGLDWISLKGPLLSRKIFGDYHFRESVDLDVLVPADRIRDAERELTRLGYRRRFPAFTLTQSQEKGFRRIYHTVNYYHAPSNQMVELHWRLFNHPGLLPASFTL